MTVAHPNDPSAADRPVIGLTGGRIHGEDIVDNLDVLRHSPVDVFYADYSRALLSAGGRPIFIPLDASPSDYLDLLDGILITGGNDIDPGRYGADLSPETTDVDAVRDAFELELLPHLAERALPTLGICRGLQLVNVHFGGTLHQHVPHHAKLDAPATELHHEVTFAADSTLRRVYGERRHVNSLHHQAIDQLGSELRTTATSTDDGVEGIEHVTLPITAVQWHPEMLPTADSDPVFRWLVDEAAARRATR